MGEGAQGRGAELSGGRDWARRDGVERARRDMVWTALARAVRARRRGLGRGHHREQEIKMMSFGARRRMCPGYAVTVSSTRFHQM